MRKQLTRLGALLAATSLLAACGGTSSGDEAAEPETREVEHAMGVAEVPADPKRVVVLDTGELDDALALGVKPVGAVRIDVATGFLSYLEGRPRKSRRSGRSPNPTWRGSPLSSPTSSCPAPCVTRTIYEQLNAIAPTVLAPDLGDTWKENLICTPTR